MAQRGRPPHPEMLTPREQEVHALLREGLTNPEIAARLGITRETVKHRVSEIISKLGVTTRQEAAAWRPEAALTPPHRPWWTPLLAWLRPLTLAKAAGLAASLAAVTGLAMVAWGVLRSARDNPESAPIVPTPEAVIDTSSGEPIKLVAGMYRLSPDGDQLARIASPQFTIDDQHLIGESSPMTSISPNGRWLAFVPEAGGPIFLKDLESGSPPEPAADFADVRELAISPDGRRLIVRGYPGSQSGTPAEGPQTYAVDVGSGAVEVLPQLTGASQIAWSPDGNRVGFTAGDTVKIADPRGSDSRSLTGGSMFAWSPHGPGLAAVHAAEIFISSGLDETGRSFPLRDSSRYQVSWSPDASRLVLSHRSHIEDSILLLDLSNARTSVLAFGYSAVWSYDGSRIAYISKGRLFVTELATGESVEPVAFVQPLVSSAQWLYDGGLLLVYNPSNLNSLIVVDRNGKNEEHLGYGAGAVWSPDGKHVAMHGREISWGLGGRTEIWVITADGSDAVEIGSYSNGDFVYCSVESPDISWNGDNSAVRFFSQTSETSWVASADGSSPATVLDSTCSVPAPDREALISRPTYESDGVSFSVISSDGSVLLRARGDRPTWSPDSRSIAYWGKDGLYVADTESGESRLIAELDISDVHGFSSGETVWSPDARRIAYAIGDEGFTGLQLFVVPVDGSSSQKFIANGGDASWSPDGDSLVYVRSSGEAITQDIYVAGVSGDNEQLLAQGWNPSWSPDGSRILFER